MYLVWNWAVPLSDCVEALPANLAPAALQMPTCTGGWPTVFWRDHRQIYHNVHLHALPILYDRVFYARGGRRRGCPGRRRSLRDRDVHSRMHAGHGGRETWLSRRCVFLKNIGDRNVAEHLVAAVENQVLLLCYLHPSHGGGAMDDIAVDDDAFGLWLLRVRLRMYDDWCLAPRPRWY